MPDQFDGLTRKSRTFKGHHQYTYGVQGGLPSDGYPKYFRSNDQELGTGRQVTLSDGHPWPPRSREQEDIGGPFRTTRYYLTNEVGGKPLGPQDFPEYWVSSYAWGTRSELAWPVGYYFRAKFLPVSPTQSVEQWWKTNFPTVPWSSESALLAKGTTAIARCKPTNPAADLGVGLAEVLREGVPSLPGISTWKDRTDPLRGASSEFLNTVFGWQPLVSEIRSVASAASRQDQLWRQYQRDAGRVVRRRYSFPTEKTVVDRGSQFDRSPTPAAYGSSIAPCWSKATGTLHRTLTTVRDVWFSGAFTYYLPKAEGEGALSSWFNSMMKLKSIYGLTLDPDVVWNLTPWSWAFDWISNAGDVISNVTDSVTDGLVLRYGYVMEHVTEYYEYSLTGLRPRKGNAPSDLSLVLVRENKQRLRATPYGFGLSWDSFSPKQLAILAALGITRS